MTRYDVYLEMSDEGESMAHIPELPGCHARGLTKQQALDGLITAVTEYHAMLRRHGEDSPDPEDIALELMEIVPGAVPFQRGSIAALFEPDTHPLSRDEMENDYLQRASYTRLDLLDLVHDLADEALDWKPAADAMSIREILRHVGNTEEWYTSRVVPLEALPTAWQHDAALPIFEFLDLERRTAFECLRSLSERELREIVTPAHFTDFPHEQWTARKALRRLLEHEIEHARHIKEVLIAREANRA